MFLAALDALLAGEALWVLVQSAEGDALFSAEAPPDGPDSGDF